MAGIKIIEEQHELSSGSLMVESQLCDGIPLERQRIASQQMWPSSIAEVVDRLRLGKSLRPKQRMGQAQRRALKQRLVLASLPHIGERMLGIAPFPHGHECIAETQQRPIPIEGNTDRMGHGLLVKGLRLLEGALLEIEIGDPPFGSPGVGRLWMIPKELFVL